MKRFLALILAISIFVTGSVFAMAAEKGDVDGDGTITSADAREALRLAVGLDALTDEKKNLADYDGNGTVQAADARAILRVSVGLPVEESDNSGSSDVQTPVQKPVHVPSAREQLLYEKLYEIGHAQLGGHLAIMDDSSILWPLLKNFQKWCAYYTIVKVFRPALEAAGYSKPDIDRLAPTSYSLDSTVKMLKNVLPEGLQWMASEKLAFECPVQVPSLLADYYIKTPAAADSYFLNDYYDDIVENKVYEYSEEDRANYTPRIGDILFISNKAKTFVGDYPTIDHTAQIIKILPDGTFICTEGSLIDYSSGSEVAKVEERRYMYDKETQSYCLIDANKTTIWRSIVVLYAAQPKF